ncbi:MAG: PHP domain-containing protein [Candidatus Heimdallarchaeota archaeon]
MLSIDFHIHTYYSADSLLSPRTLLQVAQKKNLDGVAVTDHDTTKGVYVLRKLVRKDNPFLIIPGVEIQTCEGELLLLFEIDLPPLKGTPYPPVAHVLDAAKEIDAVIALPHPFDRFRKGIHPRRLWKWIDVIESFNSRVFLPSYNTKARTFALQYGIPQIAGSDAHSPFEVGGARTMMQVNGDDLEEIRNCLIRGKTKIDGRLSNPVYKVLGWVWKITR